VAAPGTRVVVRKGRGHRHLYTALVMNAIASHYLEDFFAPGMTTPRGVPHDLHPEQHDLYNRRSQLVLPAIPNRASLSR
jgi:hypothetical protein